MTTMDRKLFRDFFEAYVICYVCLVGLFVVIHLMANFDEFVEDKTPTSVVVRRVCTYYFFHSFEYFDKIAPFVNSVAAMATLAALHRNNELIALLSAGVPARRALAPVLLGIACAITFRTINTEIIIPANASILQRLPENIDADKPVISSPGMNKDEQILIRSRDAKLNEQAIYDARFILPESTVGKLQEINAPRAEYRIDPVSNRRGWLIHRPERPIQIVTPSDMVRELKNDANDFYLFSQVTFTDLVKRPNWYETASTAELISHLKSDDARDPQRLRISVHKRFVQPLLDFILVLLGVPFVLQWERKNPYFGIAISMLISCSVMVFSITVDYVAKFGYFDPVTAAWLPIFVYGPLAPALMHRIGT